MSRNHCFSNEDDAESLGRLGLHPHGQGGCIPAVGLDCGGWSICFIILFCLLTTKKEKHILGSIALGCAWKRFLIDVIFLFSLIHFSTTPIHTIVVFRGVLLYTKSSVMTVWRWGSNLHISVTSTTCAFLLYFTLCFSIWKRSSSLFAKANADFILSELRY
jgi:hypothetical protein